MFASKGNKVVVEYEGRLESGEIFDSSKHGDHSHPLEFVVGGGMVILGFDEAVIGMEKDGEKEVTIMPNKGYGEHNPTLIKEIPKNVLPHEQEPKEGMILMMSTPDEKNFPVKIIKVNDETVSLDLNHPLAGKKIIFKIKLIGVEA